MSEEIIQGYTIKRSILFENDRGFAVGEDTDAPNPFVSWRFKVDENGVRDYLGSIL